jgi:putative ABC transport system permease protein
MAWLARIWNTLRSGGLDGDLEEELRHHRALRARDLEQTGVPESAARMEASVRLGNFTLQKERTREMDIATGLETVFKDLRYALRQFAHNPTFSTVAVLSLALGIGANTAIFSVLNAALLKSLPVRNPQELVILTNPDRSGVYIGSAKGERDLLTYTEFEKLRDRSTTLDLCASESSLNRWSVRIANGSQEDARGRLVSEEYFAVLGVDPLIGRFFAKTAGAVISYDYWQRRFAGKADALGAPIRVYGAALTVIGVAPPGFHGETVGESPDIWAPMRMEPFVKPGRDWIHEDLTKSIEKVMWLHVFGRLKPGVSLAKAQAEISVLFKTILEDGYPKTLSERTRKNLFDQHVRVRDARTGAFGGRNEFSQQLFVLLITAGLVLLIACANVANLLLARATARHREVGIRLSIGAGKGRLIRQFLTESLLLAALGAAAGLMIAASAVRVLVLLVSPGNQRQLATTFDWRVLAFTGAVTLLTGLLFGLAPALRGTRVDISESLKETSRNTTSAGKRMTFAKGLVAVQIALSLLLVVSAGLFLRTLWNLQSVMPGYSKQNLLLVGIDALTAGYHEAQRPLLYNEITDRLRRLPGVRAVTYSQNGLFSGHDSGDTVDVEGFVHKTREDAYAAYDQIGPGYFSNMGIPLLLGREIELRDTANSLRVCVINEAFAKRFFAGRNPIGRHVTDTYGDTHLTMEVIGVATDVRDHRLRGEVQERFYVAAAQGDGPIPPSIYFEVRTIANPLHALSAVRQAILRVDANLPILDARAVSDLIDAQNAQPRMIARLCGIFGAIALLLAATGLYGVLSYNIARRTNEIGIRMALGAGHSSVIGMIFKETSIWIGVGMLGGIAAVFATTRLIASRLYGLSALDPATIAIGLAILGMAALIASYVPAVRAARVNPIAALRHE